MFCPKCGASNMDNAGFCAQCGEVLAANNATSQTDNFGSSSQNDNFGIPTSVPAVKVNKKEYFATVASDSCKKKRKIAFLISIVCLVFILASAIIVNNMSVFNIPVFDMAIDEWDEIEDDYDDIIDEFEDAADDEIDELEDELDMDFKDIKKLFKNPSINNFAKIAKVIDGMGGDTAEAFTMFKVIIWVCVIIIAIFSLLTVLTKKYGFAIAGMIISLPYFILFAGMLMMVIFFVLNIAMIVLYNMTNNEYKGYKYGK